MPQFTRHLDFDGIRIERFSLRKSPEHHALAFDAGLGMARAYRLPPGSGQFRHLPDHGCGGSLLTVEAYQRKRGAQIDPLIWRRTTSLRFRIRRGIEPTQGDGRNAGQSSVAFDGDRVSFRRAHQLGACVAQRAAERYRKWCAEGRD